MSLTWCVDSQGGRKLYTRLLYIYLFFTTHWSSRPSRFTGGNQVKGKVYSSNRY